MKLSNKPGDCESTVLTQRVQHEDSNGFVIEVCNLAPTKNLFISTACKNELIKCEKEGMEWFSVMLGREEVFELQKYLQNWLNNGFF